MAYKFQTLAARMSGSLTQEGDFKVFDHSNNEKASIGIDGAMSGSGALSAGGNLRTAGTVRFDGVASAAVDVAGDFMYFLDDSDSLVKRRAVGDFAADIAGDGLIASSNQLAVQVDDSTIETNSDTLRLKDDGVTGAKLAPAVAGVGLGQDGSGNLDVQVSGAIHVASDKVSLSGSITGDALDFAGGVDSISTIHVVADESTIEAAGRASLQVKAAGITATQLATSVAGDGLTGGGGSALAVGAGSLIDVQADQVDVDLTEAAAATIANGDFLIYLDGGTAGAASKGSTADLAALFDGDGLSRSNSTLSVAVSGAVHIASDKVSITGSLAGDCLDKGATDGVDSIRTLHVVADETTIESAGRSSLRIKDDGVTGAKLAPAVAGAGLVQDGSGNLDIGAGSLIDVQADQIDVDLTEAAAATIADGDFLIFLDGGTAGAESKGSTADLAALLDGAGLTRTNSTLAVVNATNGGLAVNANDVQVDLNDLSAATVSVANDSIAIIDADDSNGTKKESIADLVGAMAGSGLAATNGVLSVQGNTVSAKADGDTLTEGYNVFADLNSNATVTLPSGSQGDVVVIKAKNLTSGANIIINPSGSQAIDGLTGAGAIRIESPFGAVSLVYAQANDWRIV